MSDQSHAVVKVITYGTFDLLHDGHIRLLERAKALGDFLIVGVTTDQFDETRGKLNVRENVIERVARVQATGLADRIIIEEYEGQKINDIQRYGVDIFAIGSDWLGKFDYLNDYCKVVYLERTAGVSSTQLRAQAFGIARLGVVTAGIVAGKFIDEAMRVSGLEVQAVFDPDESVAEDFAQNRNLPQHYSAYTDMLENVDAVYIAGPFEHHYERAKTALERGIHVLCQPPLTLSTQETEQLYRLAQERELVLLEGSRTAYCPGFIRLVALARSGTIGQVRSVDATVTSSADKLAASAPFGGSITALSSAPLLAISKIIDGDPEEITFNAFREKRGAVDYFSRIHLKYSEAIASATVGVGACSEGHLTVSGTEGSIYVPAPWWNTVDLFLRFEDPSRNKSFHFPFEGDGRRYEIAEFISMIQDKRLKSFKMRPVDSRFISAAIQAFRERHPVDK